MSSGKRSSGLLNDATERRAVPIPGGVKNIVRSWPPVLRAWTSYRAAQVEDEYRRRREHYARLAEDRRIVYREPEVVASIRARLNTRGYSPVRKTAGDIHTFACIPLVSWHQHLLPDLRELGPLTTFDYISLGYDSDLLSRGQEKLDEMSTSMVAALRNAHAQRPIDWVFFYGGGQDISPSFVRRVTEEFGIPVVNMSLDDKQGWAGASMRPWRTGAVDITKEFDLYATSARVACEWHLLEGGRPIYMPEGFDASAHAPRPVERDLDVSFVGVAYGFRLAIVAYLRKHGVNITTFGAGWPRSGWTNDIIEVFNRSKINLGMGGIEYSEALTNVKGRDFEIPGTGGGMYLTSFNPDLAQHFEAGSEIACYRNRDEMLELIRWYLTHPDEAQELASRARERSLREHRWLHRYEKILRILGVLREDES